MRARVKTVRRNEIWKNDRTEKEDKKNDNKLNENVNVNETEIADICIFLPIAAFLVSHSNVSTQFLFVLLFSSPV